MDNKDPIKTVIWQGTDENLHHEHYWNVEIDAPGWDEDRGFDTLQEAYDYITRWAKGRGLRCSVNFGFTVGK